MSDSRPWYRQGWPWFLILLPAIMVVACFITLYLALRTDEALVRDDYYKEGLAINRRLEQEAYAREHGISAELRYDPATLGLELRLVGAARADAQLTLSIVHPTDDHRDQTISLQAAGDGLFLGKATESLDGKRYLLLQHGEAGANAWRLRGTLLPDAAGAVETLTLDDR
jgi:hypothetical protein